MLRGREGSKIIIYEVLCRDGTQGEGCSLNWVDKIRLIRLFDEMGIPYVEAGWPGSNRTDRKLFKELKKIKFKQVKIAAFGSTHHPGKKISKDSIFQALIKSEAMVLTIFGKAWDLHVTEALRVSLDRNLEIIFDSIRYLKKYADEVYFDGEHFFDGYRDNKEYALQVIKTAEDAGTNGVILCDTNGGTLPYDIPAIMEEVKKTISVSIGIHCHNDTEHAVANSEMALYYGATHLQGTMLGLGERTGNANLCSLIPNIILKMKRDCGISLEQLKYLYNNSRFIAETLNMKVPDFMPWVGKSAFAHKGGIHVSAIRRNPKTYEHSDPALVGNKQRVIASELSGKSNLRYKANELELKFPEDAGAQDILLQELKRLSAEGFDYEVADASLELLFDKIVGARHIFFEPLSYRLIIEKHEGDQNPETEATVRVRVNDKIIKRNATGDGPVNALDNAIRKAISQCFPIIRKVKLSDYKVALINGKKGTAAKTRVLIFSSNDRKEWVTVGTSTNIVEASWQALVDGIKYCLLKQEDIESSPILY